MRCVLATTVAFVFLLSGCGSDDDGNATVQPPAGSTGATVPAAQPVALTDAMSAEFGAASIVPDSSSLFTTSLRLGEQWELVRESRAMKLLLDLPAVQMALGELTQSQPWLELQRMRARDPRVETGMQVLADAVSQEVFLCLDDRWPDFVSAYTSIYVRSSFAAMRGEAAAQTNALVAAIVDEASNLRLPGALLGFRLADPARAASLLDELAAQLAEGPVPPAVEEIGGGRFHTLRLDASAIPAQIRSQINRELARSRVPMDRVTRLNAWIDAQKLAVAVGVRGDYLVLSIGPDTAQLAALGGESPLARSAKFAPARRAFKPGVLSLSYLCAALTNSGKIRTDSALALVDEGLSWLGTLPDGLAARVRKDAAGILEDVNQGLPAAHDELSISFLNRGVETFTFGAVPPSMDASRPLSILSSAGRSPLLAFAGRSLSSKAAYDRFVHWCGVLYGYFEDYAVPHIRERDRADYEAFRDTFLPCVRRLHETTANKLIPAIDACQSLFVLDGGGQLTAIPGFATGLPGPLRYPRPAIVLEINDEKLLTGAFTDYRATINSFLSAMAERETDFPGLQLPPPQSREFHGGRLYWYPVPLPPWLELLPHGVVTKDRAVLAVSEAQSEELLGTSSLPADSVVDLGQPSGSAGFVDIAGITGMMLDDADVLVRAAAAKGAIDPGTAGFVRDHLPVARRVLGVFKRYSTRTWVEGDTAVTHAWLEMEDVAK